MINLKLTGSQSVNYRRKGERDRRVAESLELYKSGVSPVEIAKKYRVQPRTARQYLRAAGITHFPKEKIAPEKKRKIDIARLMRGWKRTEVTPDEARRLRRRLLDDYFARTLGA